jgi:AsmA protein
MRAAYPALALAYRYTPALLELRLSLDEGMQLNQRTLKIAGIVVAGVLVILLALPLFINVDSFRPKIESLLTNTLGRQVTMGKLSLSIFSGSVTVEKVSFADDPAFSKSPFVTASSLKVGVKLLPLIFSKELNVTGILLETPQITLLKSPNGTWNFSSLGGAVEKGPSDPKESPASQNLTIAKMEIKNGKIAIGDTNSSSVLQVYENVNVEMANFSPTSRFPFELTADLPGGGNAKVSGKAGPMNLSDSAKTPFDATVKVNDLDLAASGFVSPGSGIGGVTDFEGTLNSNGNQAKVVGVITCNELKLSPKGTPASKEVSVNYSLDADLNAQSVIVTQADVAIGKATARLTGTTRTRGDTQVLTIRLNAPNMPIDELEAMLPAMGIKLPSGSKLKGGTLSADLAISGTLDQPVIAGPVRMSNVKLAGFDIGSKLGALSSFTGKARSSPDTTIQNASLNARVAPEMTKADSINVTIASLGAVSGAGTVSPSGALDFRMLADLESERSDARADRRGRDSQRGIPFMIQGTASNPTFVPDVAGMAGGAVSGALQGAVSQRTGGPTSAVGGLLGRRKSK